METRRAPGVTWSRLTLAIGSVDGHRHLAQPALNPPRPDLRVDGLPVEVGVVGDLHDKGRVRRVPVSCDARNGDVRRVEVAGWGLVHA